ncbi:MAG: TatD family hydrolase [Gemmatimonadota bacterium]|nr:TatD family hydrolase [Gemmatimonadota bacterium]
MASFIDSHAHLADQAFAGDRDAVIGRARDAGAAAIICIGASIEQGRDSARIAAQHPGFVAFTAGVHPHDASSFNRDDDIAALDSLVAQGAVAIGECGLDYHYDNSPRDMQKTAFAAQLQLAARHSLPVVVHTRDAENDTRAMVTEAGRVGVAGVLHCFTGSLALATAALEVGWYISFSGIVTFRSWTGDDVIAAIPEDRLLVESDAPYLAPVPHRGRRNEPAWVESTLARVALARGVTASEIARTTTVNARTLFRI